MSAATHAPDKPIDLRLGRYQEALADVTCDALISDPPYSARTHVGHNDGSASANENRASTGETERRLLDYSCWDAMHVDAFVTAWSARVRGWMVVLTDHVLVPAWESAFVRVGRYCFAPLQFMHVGSRVRIVGDGPALWSTTIMVARPRTREYARWGALAGGYVLPGTEHDSAAALSAGIVGRKPLWLMRALVRDYSRAGDLICDPCAGGGTTLLAAAIERRRAVGSEMDSDTHAKASARIARGYTPTFDFGDAAEP